ncbi:MAG: hypothetical protein HC837_17410 [Chloroflexaceae bacterium]|nr:hypothetical protein [Chloroflexaceae bacterium]
MGIYEIKATTTVAATPEQVWAVLDDFGNWPAWMPSMQGLRIDLLSSGEPRMGYRFRLRGKVTAAELEVTGFDRYERSTRFRLNLPPLSGENHCRLIPLEDGHYRIERFDRLKLPGPVIKFLDATQRARFEKLAAEFVLTLKRTTEERANHAQTNHSKPASNRRT